MTKLPFIFLCLLILVLTSCSTSNKSGNVGFGRKAYHDITSRNNAYFNADQKLKTIEENIASSHKDDYDKILSLYPQRDPEIAKTYTSDLDEVVKKTSAAIKFHEPARWTQNNYLLIGHSYFLKGDYSNALETFQFVTTEFNNEKVSKEEVSSSKKKKKKLKKKKKKKKRKKKGKPQSAMQIRESQKEAHKKSKNSAKSTAKEEEKKKTTGLFIHNPTRPEALIWLVDTYTQLEKYKEAQSVITIIEADEYFPDDLKENLELAKANLYIREGAIANAIEPVSNVISEIKRKKKKSRYYYILAQIYEKLHQYPSALENYQAVLKCRPQFEMEFNAKLSIARVAGFDNSLSYEEIAEILHKLLKDSKNEDFYDQIYYALAQLALNNGNKEEGIDNLKKSIKSSTSNSEQKALSYLQIGEIYFNDEQYREAYPYYDSTLTLLSSDHPKYSEVDSRKTILGNLVTQLEIIEEQDSIQGLMNLSDAEREKLVENYIKKKEKEKEKLVTNDEQQNTFLKNKEVTEDKNAQASASGFYFYNTSAKSQGYNNFIKKWGQRKLEDNWRRSEKGSTLEALPTVDNDSEQDSSGTSLAEDDLDKESLLASFSLSKEDLKKSNKQLVEAYYQLATIYRIDLKNASHAIATYEELIKRFPENKYLAESYYSLFLLYQAKGDGQKTNYYKNKLISEFPDSKYTKIVQNPNYLEASKNKDEQLNNYYKTAYELYTQNKIDETLAYINRADSLFKNNTLKPKFALLQAFAIGKKKDLPGYIAALQQVVTNYPEDEVKTKAEEILTYLQQSENTDVEMQMNISDYDYDPDAIHFFVIAYDADEDIVSTELINKIAVYNDKNRSLENLKVNSLALNNEYTLVIVKNFDNKKSAFDYYNDITTDPDVFSDYKDKSLEFCIASDINFNKIILHREIQSYLRFFNTKYLKH